MQFFSLHSELALDSGQRRFQCMGDPGRIGGLLAAARRRPPAGREAVEVQLRNTEIQGRTEFIIRFKNEGQQALYPAVAHCLVSIQYKAERIDPQVLIIKVKGSVETPEFVSSG